MNRIISYKSLDERNVVNNGEIEILDMTSQVFKLTKYPRILNKIIVTDDLAGKPNVISLIYYGTEDYTDMLCFFNGISNPFNLQPGQVILVPYLEDIQSMVVSNTATANGQASNKSNDSIISKMTTKDPRRNMPIGDNRRLVNTTIPGTSNVVVDGDQIVLGSNANNGLCDQNNSTATKSKSAAIRSSIIRSIKSSQ